MKSKQILYLFSTYAYICIFSFLYISIIGLKVEFLSIIREVELKNKLFLGIKFSFMLNISYIKISIFTE